MGKSKIDKRSKAKSLSLERKMSKHGYVFAAPFIIGFILIFVFVIFDSIKLSFNEINLATDPYSLTFVGLGNYTHAFTVDPEFLPLVAKTVGMMIPDTIIIIIFSLFVATLLNQKMRGRAFFRAVLFLPVILATGIVAKVEVSNFVQNFVESSAGAEFSDNSGNMVGIQALGGLGDFFQDFTMGNQFSEIISAAVQNIYQIINRSGVQILLFIAGLQAISPSIYESASIEGCTGWQSFWKITFPMISPVILVNMVYSVIDSFTRSDNPIMEYIENLRGMQGVGSAMAWIYFGMIILLLGVVFGIFSGYTFYQQKD